MGDEVSSVLPNESSSTYQTSLADEAMYGAFKATKESNNDFNNFKSVMVKSGYFDKAAEGVPVVGQEVPMLRLMSAQDGTIPENRGELGPMIFVTPPMRNPADWFQRTDTSSPAIPTAAFERGFDVYITCPRGGAYAKVHD